MKSTRARFAIVILSTLAVIPDSSMAAVAANTAGAAAVALQLRDVLSAKWRDGEIRSEDILATRETELSLGLLPVGQHGTLTLVFSARLQQQTPTEPPATVQVLLGAGLSVNPNVIRRSMLRFVLDPGTQHSVTIDASDRLRLLDPAPGALIENALAIIPLTEFVQLLRAEIITGEIFGLDFSLTSQQRDTLRDFGVRVLRSSR